MDEAMTTIICGTSTVLPKALLAGLVAEARAGERRLLVAVESGDLAEEDADLMIDQARRSWEVHADHPMAEDRAGALVAMIPFEDFAMDLASESPRQKGPSAEPRSRPCTGGRAVASLPAEGVPAQLFADRGETIERGIPALVPVCPERTDVVGAQTAMAADPHRREIAAVDQSDDILP